MKINALLLDLDGVLYSGDQPIEGGKEAIALLRAQGYPIRFVSNSTRRSRASIASRLQRMGYEISPPEILTPAIAAVQQIRENRQTSCFLLSTGDVSLDFSEAGIDPDDEQARWIVVGDAGDQFTYDRLVRAFRRLLEGADLIALEKDRSWMGNDGLMLSAGPFVAALEYASRKKAHLVGKPSPSFFSRAIADFTVPPDRIAMVGDDLESDIGGAQSCGMQGILVRTGKFRTDLLGTSSIRPDYILDSVASLPDLLSSQTSRGA